MLPIISSALFPRMYKSRASIAKIMPVPQKIRIAVLPAGIPMPSVFSKILQQIRPYTHYIGERKKGRQRRGNDRRAVRAVRRGNDGKGLLFLPEKNRLFARGGGPDLGNFALHFAGSAQRRSACLPVCLRLADRAQPLPPVGHPQTPCGPVARSRSRTARMPFGPKTRS